MKVLFFILGNKISLEFYGLKHYKVYENDLKKKKIIVGNCFKICFVQSKFCSYIFKNIFQSDFGAVLINSVGVRKKVPNHLLGTHGYC